MKGNGNGGSPLALPRSDECERAVLAAFNVAAIQGRPGAVDRLLDMLEADAFFAERHQLIWEAVRRIRARDEPVDLRTLQGELEQGGAFEVCGGFAYLAGLDMDLPDIGRVDTYAAILRERWARRTLILKATEATAGSFEGEAAEVLIADLQQALLEIEQARTAGGDFHSIADVVMDLDPFEARPGGLLGLGTGLADLDSVTRGFQNGQLVVIAGRPSMGKTSLALQIATHQALAGARAGFVSLEDVRDRLAVKALSQSSGIPHQRISLGRVSSVEQSRLYEAIRRVSASALWINDRETQTVEQVCAAARLQATRHGLDVLYVDYVNLMSAAGRWDSRNLEVGHISKAFKALAKSLSIPVVLLCQLSRKCEDRSDKRPRLADLRDSGEIEQNADTVILVFRPEVYFQGEDKGVAYLIVDKNKGGEKGAEVATVFVGETTSFRDLDRHEEPEGPQRGWG